MKKKGKKVLQKNKKQQHREQLRAAKRRKRNATPVLERNAAQNEEIQRILIVCEGEKTEPSYFDKFKLPTATIKSVGEGYNTISLVQRAMQLSKESNYDQVWCVFDKDDFKNEHFNNAILMAESYNFGVAYSNQAFEYWLILHFEDHQGGGMHRNDYCSKLNQYLKIYNVVYDCNSKEITEDIFDVLASKMEKENVLRQEKAIARAKRNYEYHDRNNPALAESCTTVFKLIEEIEQYK